MKLIVGLGNPGLQYANTRHNIGFMFIDHYVKKLNCEEEFKEKFHSMYLKLKIKNQDVILMKPLTYMNLSGNAVKEMANFYKIASKDILVVYDDKDIPFAHLRLREKGNPGSNNGMKSITLQLNDNQFPRIRIGIGQPINLQDMASFVLSKFTKDELLALESSFENAIEAANLFVEEKFVIAMNRYNNRMK